MELPKDLRFVPPHWSRSSKKVWCGDCAGGANSSAQAVSDHGGGGNAE